MLGFDGRVINSKTGESLQERLSRKQASICSDHDLIGEIWENRPELSAEPVWILEEKYAGQAASEKIKNLREAMKKAYADVHIITTLDDIVWPVSYTHLLKRLCKAWNIPLKNTIAFGDSMNDYEIVTTAGIGVAMGNGHPQLKAAADYVTAPIGEDGVYKACEALHLF